MNNRGQVLALFILMLPIFVVLSILTIDISNLAINKLEIDNINKILIDNALDKKEEPNIEEQIINLSHLNDNNINVNIIINNDKISITLNKDIKGIITKQKIYKLKSEFEGYYNNNKKIIKRIKGDNHES